jgi:hypothetical protein
MLLSGTLWVHVHASAPSWAGARRGPLLRDHHRATEPHPCNGRTGVGAQKNGAGRVSEHGWRDPTSEEKATRPRAASQLAGFFV